MNVAFKNPDTLLPCIVQDVETGNVLMLGYMNEEAYRKTRSEKTVTFYSRSKKRLWTKGETSGNFLEWVDMKTDCDSDTILIKVRPAGPVCHKGTDTCFGEKNTKPMLSRLEEIIVQRRDNPKESSYTSSLFRQGINRIAQKVGEEAIELVIASKEADDKAFLNEAADLVYHLLVLLAARNKGLAEVEHILKERHR